MKINKIGKNFNFNNLDLLEPKGVQGGLSYTTKIQYDKEPFFLQTNKCKTRNGFITSGKKCILI